MEERDKDIITQNPAEDEIDLIEIAAKLWANRRFIIKTTLIFMTIGLFIAIFTPNEYTASTILVPQTGERRASSGLTGLAAMAGVNLGSLNSGELLSPYIYPQILNNVNFQKELIYSKYNFINDSLPITYFEFITNRKYHSFNLLSFIKRYTIGLPSVIINKIKSIKPNNSISLEKRSELTGLSKNESNVARNLLNSLSLNINDKEGYIALSYTSLEPILSAEIVRTSQQLLQKYITEFKLEKVRNNLKYIEISYIEARDKFEKKQKELALFRDANKSLNTAIARTQEEKITSEYNLLLSIYSDISRQKEQAKIAINETTPIFTIIQPVTIPIDKSGPSRKLTFMFFSLLGFLFSCVWILFHSTIFNFIKLIKGKSI